MFFRPKVKYTDASAKVVGFFLQQYVEVMKHAKDRTDARMKDYLFAVIEGLGVPLADIDIVEPEPETEPEEPTLLPIINRRMVYGK